MKRSNQLAICGTCPPPPRASRGVYFREQQALISISYRDSPALAIRLLRSTPTSPALLERASSSLRKARSPARLLRSTDPERKDCKIRVTFDLFYRIATCPPFFF
ncbi:hypothetical protein KFK09_021508 [Dendrobium nobile]|uniref:Uncharacterized protein n=1 Tax=Dendrobium nobile TaxID=94219 RepID=A0A8T3AQ38_DENNO|nr:hypothetical protein KFK09_021508 [Dendrobium nobile]